MNHPALDAIRAYGAAVQKSMRGTVNYGGCGVYAAHVAKWLSSQGIPAWCKVTGYHSMDTPLNLFERNLSPLPEDPNDYPFDFNHIIVVARVRGIGTIWHDCDSTVRPWSAARSGIFGRQRYRRGWLTAAAVAAITQTQYGWNRTCDHNTLRAVMERHAPLLKVA